MTSPVPSAGHRGEDGKGASRKGLLQPSKEMLKERAPFLLAVTVVKDVNPEEAAEILESERKWLRGGFL